MMKRVRFPLLGAVFLAGVLLAIGTPPAGDPQPLGNPGTWHLVFDDEFDRTSLALAKWRPNWLGPSNTAITPPTNSTEPQCYDPAQVTVSGGYLNLDAVQRPCTANNGVTYQYASGMVESNGHFNYTYGHAEALMSIPGDSANVPINWPAWWTNGKNWPSDGEDDIMEVLGRKTCFNYHNSGGQLGPICTSDQAGWHTFASDWEPGVVKYYFDGVQVGVFTKGIASSPHYLILNHGLHKSLIQAPARVQIDYVRVWQH